MTCSGYGILHRDPDLADNCSQSVQVGKVRCREHVFQYFTQGCLVAIEDFPLNFNDRL